MWYGALESGWPLSDSSWQCYYMLGTTTKLLMPFKSQVLGLELRTLEMIHLIDLGLTITEINIKKSTRLKKH